MEINIKLYKETGGTPEDIVVTEGTSIEDIYLQLRSHLPYRIITARVDGDDVSLNKSLIRDCEVTLCDIRDNTANRTFQRGLSLIYLKAMSEVLGPFAHVLIMNSVNRGIYTTVDFVDENGNKTDRKITERDLQLVEKYMWKLVDANIAINTTTVSKEALFSYLEKIGSNEKLKLLQNAPDLSFINVCDLDGYTNYFYGIMPPSTGYIQLFALDLYHGGVLVRFPHPSDPLRIPMYTRDDKIFEAYQEEHKILEIFDLSYISDIDRAITAGNAEEMIQMAEIFHTEKIESLAEKIVASGKRVILVAGPSSSGKTTFSLRLIEAIGRHGQKPLYLGTDDYFLERENAPRDKNGEFNFEGLSAMDVKLFTSSVNSLLAGKNTDLPRFDFIEGKKFFGERFEQLAPGQSIVVEGIHALNQKMSKDVDDSTKFKIYISPLTQLNIDDHNRVPSTDIRLLRRMLRDNRTRGRDPRETLKGWRKVREGESVNIFPYNSEADEVFNSTLLYELPVIRKYAVPLLEDLRPGDPEYGYAKWLLYFLCFFRPMSDEDEALIPKESILREFVGGGMAED